MKEQKTSSWSLLTSFLLLALALSPVAVQFQTAAGFSKAAMKQDQPSPNLTLSTMVQSDASLRAGVTMGDAIKIKDGIITEDEVVIESIITSA